MVSPFAAFMLGIVMGFLFCLAIDMQFLIKGRPRTTPASKSALPFRLPWQAPAVKPAAKPTAAGAIPRSPGSWRNQKANLEREHNSKQKERDQRVAGL